MSSRTRLPSFQAAFCPHPVGCSHPFGFCSGLSPPSCKMTLRAPSRIVLQQGVKGDRGESPPFSPFQEGALPEPPSPREEWLGLGSPVAGEPREWLAPEQRAGAGKARSWKWQLAGSW